MGPFGVPELAIMLVIVVIIFGVGKLPEIGGTFGKSINAFKTEADDADRPIMSIDTGEQASTTADGRQPEHREVRAEDV